jgi:hypothetical protein
MWLSPHLCEDREWQRGFTVPDFTSLWFGPVLLSGSSVAFENSRNSAVKQKDQSVTNIIVTQNI